MNELDHPNIVRIHECYVEKDRIVIITQMCRGGELVDAIIKEGNLTMDDIKKILTTSCSIEFK